MSEVYRCGRNSYATPDGRFVVSRRNHPLLPLPGRPGSRVTWVVADTTGARPFSDSLGQPTTECWVGTFREAKAAVKDAA